MISQKGKFHEIERMIEQMTEVAGLKYILAFDNINEVPILLVNGKRVNGIVLVDYEWNTDKERPKHKHIKIVHAEKGSNDDLYQRTVEERTIY